MRVRGLTLALLLSAASSAAAQSAGTLEITGFGRYSVFDDSLALQEGTSGGGSLGYYPIRNLAVEAEAAYSQTHSNLSGIGVSNIPLRGRLTYHVPLGGYASAIRLGAGYVRNMYRKDVSFDDNGFTGVVGFRWGLSPSFGFRVDGTADYIRSPDGGRTGHYVNWGTQVGLSFRTGGGGHHGTPKDADKDGIANGMDRCPATPAGKTVDANGCTASERDADHDGVSDQADRCDGTGLGENVDTEGCAASQKDDDHDGVMNPVDQCPNTEQGQSVNGSGCAADQRDEDGDGVSDAIDQCPNTPAGDAVNARGCFLERDSDGDNVPDKRDRCPNTPAGVAADANGCPITAVSDIDSDGDHVPDARDRCPNTPKGEVADANGCSIAAVDERDSDGDGVPNRRDHCPDTPKGEAADANGCTILFNKGKRTVILRGVTFLPSRATLTPEARVILRDVASQLVENPQYKVQVSGHTDIRGTRAKNLRLSLARARTVETFLEANGVPPTQVTAKGFGPDVPIASNKTAAGRAKNRRVELNRTN
jgi:outer membrane protein OmpA-like peptidoglycan-associated protein